MASLWQKTLYYLGLVDESEGEPAVAPMPATEDRVEQPHETDAAYRRRQPRTVGGGNQFAVPGERVEPPPRARPRVARDPSLAEAGVYVDDESAVRPTMSTAETEIITAHAFSDAQLLADLLKDRRPVVLDLRNTEPEMVRRLVDFASGLVYALDGTMRKVAQGVILVTPPRVTVSRDERRRLANMGLYQAADIG